MDLSVAIRKQSMDSLSSLLEQYPGHRRCRRHTRYAEAHCRADSEVLQKVWLGAVLPLAGDRESSVQDKCFQLVQVVESRVAAVACGDAACVGLCRRAYSRQL
jgi:hypothetical protein